MTYFVSIGTSQLSQSVNHSLPVSEVETAEVQSRVWSCGRRIIYVMVFALISVSRKDSRVWRPV